MCVGEPGSTELSDSECVGEGMSVSAAAAFALELLVGSTDLAAAIALAMDDEEVVVEEEEEPDVGGGEREAADDLNIDPMGLRARTRMSMFLVWRLGSKLRQVVDIQRRRKTAGDGGRQREDAATCV